MPWKNETKVVELIVAKFDVDGLTAPALDVLKAAVTHAHTNLNIRLHNMPIESFCQIAGLPSLSFEEFTAILQEACGALAVVEAVDTESPERDDLPYSSWPVFEKVLVEGSNFIFEINKRTFDETLMANLSHLTATMRKRTREIHLVGVSAPGSSLASKTWKVFSF